MTEQGAGPSACPLPLGVLPSNYQKHVDRKAPVPLRMMGAKALVPMGPKDMATALFMLTFDPTRRVRQTAVKTVVGLPDRILALALRDESAETKVLDYYAGALAEKPEYLEMLVLNPSTPDETVARIAMSPHERLAELVSQIQLRLLRHDPIVRALVTNPATRPLTVDNITDFCVRSSLVLPDLPAFQAARKRVLGTAADDAATLAAVAAAQAEEAAAERALEEMGSPRPEAKRGARRDAGAGGRVGGQAPHHRAEDLQALHRQEDRVGEQEGEQGGPHHPPARPHQARPAGGGAEPAHQRGRDRQGGERPHLSRRGAAIHLQQPAADQGLLDQGQPGEQPQGPLAVAMRFLSLLRSKR